MQCVVQSGRTEVYWLATDPFLYKEMYKWLENQIIYIRKYRKKQD
jgi:hypothetical protein